MGQIAKINGCRVVGESMNVTGNSGLAHETSYRPS